MLLWLYMKQKKELNSINSSTVERVSCPNCGYHLMKRNRSVYLCPICKTGFQPEGFDENDI